MNRRTLLAGILAGGASRAWAATPVDLLLVLAVDVSGSVTPDEAKLQRDGYRNAVTDPQVVAAMTGGPVGAIAVAYVEWAGVSYQELVIPWTRIGGQADATAWADALAAKPRRSVIWTSLSGALAFSRQTLADCPFDGTRKVVDVSGDGPNNNGPPAEPERDRLIEEGVTINGLPIINNTGRFGSGESVVPYYRESVIGGPGAFLIVAKDFDDFAAAIRRKLIQEIALAL